MEGGRGKAFTLLFSRSLFVPISILHTSPTANLSSSANHNLGALSKEFTSVTCRICYLCNEIQEEMYIIDDKDAMGSSIITACNCPKERCKSGIVGGHEDTCLNRSWPAVSQIW